VTVIARLKPIFEGGSYSEVYGWLQAAIRLHPERSFGDKVAGILEQCQSPYRLLEGDVLMPVGSEAEANTISQALVDLAPPEFSGPRAHLRAAAAELTEGHFADSVRESIHAVESVAKLLEPTGDLSKALAKLEGSAKIHGALKSGFASLYGYSSNNPGIRHPLLDKDAADVDEADALFMIGACAAFVSYLINKARKAGILD
jgi:hypothetical protein